MKNNKRKPLIMLGVAVLAGLLAGCGSKQNMATYEKLGYVDIAVNNLELHLDLESENKVLEIESLNTENELPIQIVSKADAYNVVFDGNELSEDTEFMYKLDKIEPEYVIPISVEDKETGGITTFMLNTWPEELPQYSVVGSSPYEGDYYITPLMNGSGAAYKVDECGNLLYYRYSDKHSFEDFKKVETEDGVRYLMFESVPTEHAPHAYTTVGEYVVFDEQYNELKRLRLAESDVITDTDWPIDQHDVLYISDSEYYLIGYVEKNVNNIPDTIPHKEPSSLVVAGVIQGFKNGELVFEWDSTNYPELYEDSIEYNDYTNTTDIFADYVHINSLDLDENDGNLIVSCRMLDAVLKINTTDGSIIWKLGGVADSFGLTPEQKTSRQHYARYNPNGSITVYDNGNINNQSRVVEYWLDEENLSLKDFKVYQVDGYYAWATGSAQRIDNEQDVFVIGWGYRSADEVVLFPNMSEINFTTNETLFEFRFKDRSLSTYRCVKY